jgi:putative transposase
MTSPAPLLFDTHYHIYNRGNNRENIFPQERNYEYFINLYHKYIDPIADTFAYCLLGNHFHLLVRIKSEQEILKSLNLFSSQHAINKQGNAGEQVVCTTSKPLGSAYPSRQFSRFFNAYAKAINQALNRTGSLFQHPFGRVQIGTDQNFWNVIAYIHLNPQKHKFVEDFREWKWSSYGILLSEQPTRLERQVVLDWFGGRDGYRELHEQWVSHPTFAREDED